MKKIDAPFIESFLEVNKFLSSNQIRYCLIGGLAAGFWGEPRYTQDMDFTVALKEDSFDAFIKLLNANKFIFTKKSVNRVELTQKGRLNFQADLILSETEFQEWVVRRAIEVEIFQVKIPICTPEDLIILKLLANRRQDLLDIENILKKRSQGIDQEYLKNWLKVWKLEKLFKNEFSSYLR